MNAIFIDSHYDPSDPKDDAPLNETDKLLKFAKATEQFSMKDIQRVVEYL